MKSFGDDKSKFKSLFENKELMNELEYSTDREAVFVASAALDILLDRLVLKFLGKTKIPSYLDKFSIKISFCHSLGLIAEDEKHDLNHIKEVRNSFAHNLYGCSFENDEVKDFLSTLLLSKKNGASVSRLGLRGYFISSVLTLDNHINNRITYCEQVKLCTSYFA